ncbi:hypothetical protein [Streptomyces sp. NPDC004538]|uniref:hypothetical protein n=1 Tax=Streptomyces sp. NPDC004538 TaxID=3154279 RepID=UPI0033BB562A
MSGRPRSRTLTSDRRAWAGRRAVVASGEKVATLDAGADDYITEPISMAQLRRKLETDPSHPRYLVTKAGMGHRFEG